MPSADYPAAGHLEARIMDKLEVITASVHKMETAIIRLEGDLSHHMSAEEKRTAQQVTMDLRLQTLEALQQQAKGAATMAKLLWAIAFALAGFGGWVLRHLSVKP